MVPWDDNYCDWRGRRCSCTANTRIFYGTSSNAGTSNYYFIEPMPEPAAKNWRWFHVLGGWKQVVLTTVTRLIEPTRKFNRERLPTLQRAQQKRRAFLHQLRGN